MPIIEAIDAAEQINASRSQLLAGKYSDDRRVTLTLATRSPSSM
jgi:hypothetical protein